MSGTDFLHEKLLRGDQHTHLTPNTQQSHSGASHILETQNLPATTHAPEPLFHTAGLPIEGQYTLKPNTGILDSRRTKRQPKRGQPQATGQLDTVCGVYK